MTAQENRLHSIALASGGVPAGAANGERGYMLTFVIAYIRVSINSYLLGCFLGALLLLFVIVSLVIVCRGEERRRYMLNFSFNLQKY